MLKKIIPILLTSTIIITSFSFSAQVQAKNSQIKINQKSQKFDKILQNLNDKDPQKVISQKLKTVKNNENELIFEQSENFQIKFDLQNKKIKVENKNKGNLTVGIPNSEQIDSVDLVENKLIYSGKDAKFETIMEAIDGGMRQIINIKDSSAPDFYDFPVELGLDERLVINTNGSAGVIRPKSSKELENDQKISKDIPKDIKIPDYSTKLIIGKPWAKDASGIDLKTSYSVENGNILRQKIDLKDAVFPVITDPLFCGSEINYTTWIKRDGIWSDSVYPTECGAWNCSGQWSCWWYAYMWTSSHTYENGNYVFVWDKNTNYSSMYNQFYCHTDYARGWKPIWNLEPSRADKGYWGFVSNGCN